MKNRNKDAVLPAKRCMDIKRNYKEYFYESVYKKLNPFCFKPEGYLLLCVNQITSSNT
jgi:hypothetical protein